MRIHPMLIAVTLTICVLVARGEDAPRDDKYDPTNTNVVILPLVNKAAEYSADFQAKIRDKAEKSITDCFRSRGFQLVAPQVTQKCLTDMDINFDERENWHFDKIIAVGKKLNAKLVLLCVILDAHSKENDNPLFSGSIFGGAKEGFASVRAYLVDISTETSVLSGQQVKGKSTGGAFGNLDKGMDRQTTAIVKGFDQALKEFLIAYPEVKRETVK